MLGRISEKARGFLRGFAAACATAAADPAVETPLVGKGSRDKVAIYANYAAALLRDERAQRLPESGSEREGKPHGQ